MVQFTSARRDESVESFASRICFFRAGHVFPFLAIAAKSLDRTGDLMPRYISQHTLACLTRQGAEELSKRLLGGKPVAARRIVFNMHAKNWKNGSPPVSFTSIGCFASNSRPPVTVHCNQSLNWPRLHCGFQGSRCILKKMICHQRLAQGCCCPIRRQVPSGMGK